MVTAGAGLTVNVALQVLGASQSEVTVKVMVAVPPQWLGAEAPLLVSVPLQPPKNDAVLFHALNLVSMADCV